MFTIREIAAAVCNWFCLAGMFISEYRRDISACKNLERKNLVFPIAEEGEYDLPLTYGFVYD